MAADYGIVPYIGSYSVIQVHQQQRINISVP